jgi:N-acetylmuramoyl-L-alanine amidase
LLFGLPEEGEILKDFSVLSYEEEAGVTSEVTMTFDRCYYPEVKDQEEYFIIHLKKYQEVYDKIVVLDAGHGGKDPGALRTYTVNGKKITIQEKDITLKVGQLLYKKLKQTYPEKQIIMTRSTDKFLSLGERTDVANSVKLQKDEAVIYVSVHVNASLDKKASGYEVWYLSPGYRRTVLDKSVAQDDKSLFPILNSLMEEEYTTESILMAKFIMDGLQAQIGNKSKSRGIKAEEWFVVRNANMPSVLIEVGFLTNQEEAMNLNSDSYLQKTTQGIYNGISAFVTHFERSRGFTTKK